MYDAILYEGQLTVSMTYRTGATDANMRRLQDLLEQTGMVSEDEEVAAANLCLYLSCTVFMRLDMTTTSPQLVEIAAFWEHFANEVRTVLEPIPGLTCFGLTDDLTAIAYLWHLYRLTLPAKFVHEMWRVAWGNAQKMLYPATSDTKPEADLTDEERADDFLDNGAKSVEDSTESKQPITSKASSDNVS